MPDKAIECCNKALEILPNNRTGLWQKISLTGLGKHEDAEDCSNRLKNATIDDRRPKIDGTFLDEIIVNDLW